MKKNPKLQVAVLGLSHLGLVVSASLTKSGYKVSCFDLDKRNINNLKSKGLFILEPNLKSIFNKYLDNNLQISSKYKDVIKNKDYIFITLDTPVNNYDEVELTSLNKLFDLVIKHTSKKTTIIILSQVPIGTTRIFLKKLRSKNKVVYFPENLRLGTAVDDFLNPSRIIIGSDDHNITEQFLKDFPIFKCKVLKMSIESAEMLKHALNSFLALNISFTSELSDLCELLGANAEDVILGLKTDQRISPKAPISPGLGFAGGTLGRDVKTLINISTKIKYPAKLLNAVYSVNQDRLEFLIRKVKNIYPKLDNKIVGLMGLTYKPNTNTLKRSQSLEFANLLAKEKVEVRALDPAIRKNNFKYLDITSSLEAFLKDLDLLVLMTPWPQFKQISPKLVSALMKKKVIIDTKNFLNKQEYKNLGFNYIGMGEGK